MYTSWWAVIQTFQLLHTLGPLPWLLSASALVLPTSLHHGNLVLQVAGATADRSSISLSSPTYWGTNTWQPGTGLFLAPSSWDEASEFARLHFNTFFFVLVSKLRHLNLDEDSSLQAVWWSSAQLWRYKLTSFINCSLLLLSQSPWIHGRRFPSLCSLQLGGALCCFRGRQLNCFFSHSVISYLISDFTLHYRDNPPCCNHLLSLGLSDKFYRPGSSSWDPLGGCIMQSCEPGSPSTHFHVAHGKHKACSYCIWKKWWGPSLAVFVLWREESFTMRHLLCCYNVFLMGNILFK